MTIAFLYSLTFLRAKFSCVYPGNRGLLNYNKISQLNLPIGSGAVESLIRQAVNLRLKGNGKFWLEENAEIILHARCQWLSGAWSDFTNSILIWRIYPAIS